MFSKIALVTGATSGMGEASAKLLAESGFKVYGGSRDGIRAEGGPCEMLALDVTCEASVRAAVATVMEREGRIDLLVNHAGAGVLPAGAEESSVQQAQLVFDTNFFGLLRMTGAVLPHMRAQGSGRIVNIGSVLGFLPMPYGALYSATRQAIDGYTGALDQELRHWGIRAIVIEPAYTSSLFDAELLEADARVDAYQAARTMVSRRVRELMVIAEGPDVVAEAVLKAALAKRPKQRYPVGGLATRLRLLHAFTPDGAGEAGPRRDGRPLALTPTPLARPI